MGCQRAIAERILARGGDYLLTLKANHPLAQTAVIAHFEKHCFGPGASVRAVCDAFEDSHGRLVRRRVFASTDAVLGTLSIWPGLRTVLAIESIRSLHGTDKVESEIRYFLSSCRDDPAVLGAAIRAHWSIENAVHWVLDVTFRENDGRVRDRAAARNLALVRKMRSTDRPRTLRAATVRARRKGPPGTTTTCSSSWPEARSRPHSRGDFHASPLRDPVARARLTVALRPSPMLVRRHVRCIRHHTRVIWVNDSSRLPVAQSRCRDWIYALVASAGSRCGNRLIGGRC